MRIRKHTNFHNKQAASLETLRSHLQKKKKNHWAKLGKNGTTNTHYGKGWKHSTPVSVFIVHICCQVSREKYCQEQYKEFSVKHLTSKNEVSYINPSPDQGRSRLSYNL